MTDTMTDAAQRIETQQQRWKREETADAIDTLRTALDEVALFGGTLRGDQRDTAGELVGAAHTALRDLANVIDVPDRDLL